MELYCHSWTVAEPKATVVLVHGTGEHHGRYAHVARFFNAHGIEVVTGDLPGWGRSPGLKGHIDRFDQYLDAVETWIASARQASGDSRPLFLLGHSMGGLVATRFVQRYGEPRRLAGLILTSPCLELQLSVPAWKRTLGELLERVWPTLRLPNEIDADMVSRDPQIQEEYRKDPYNYAKVSVHWFQELQRAMRAAWEERERLDLPILVLQAGSDKIISAAGVERFVKGVPGDDVQFICLPGLYHEVMNEPEREEVLERITTWMEERM